MSLTGILRTSIRRPPARRIRPPRWRPRRPSHRSPRRHLPMGNPIRRPHRRNRRTPHGQPHLERTNARHRRRLRRRRSQLLLLRRHAPRLRRPMGRPQITALRRIRPSRIRRPRRRERRLLRSISMSHGGVQAESTHHPPVLEQDASGPGQSRRLQGLAAAKGSDEGKHGSFDPSFFALYQGVYCPSWGDL